MHSVIYLSDVVKIFVFIWVNAVAIYLTTKLVNYLTKPKNKDCKDAIANIPKCCESDSRNMHNNNNNNNSINFNNNEVVANNEGYVRKVTKDLTEKQHFHHLQNLTTLILLDNGQNLPLYNAQIDAFREKCSFILNNMDKNTSETHKKFGPFINDVAEKLVNNKNKELIGYVANFQTRWIKTVSE